MMKKIKHIKDIQHEKIRLRLKQLELEKQMKKNWGSIKNELPLKIINNRESGADSGRNKGDGSLLSTMINFGAGYLSRHLSEKAGQKLELTLQKGAHKLAHKLKTVLSKRK